MKLPVWIGKDKDLIEVQVPCNYLMLALISSDSSQPSVIAVLSPNDIKQLILEKETLKEWIESSETANPNNVFRLLGNALLFDSLKEPLKDLRLKEGKHLALSESTSSNLLFIPREGRIRLQKNNQTFVASVPMTAKIDKSKKTKVLVVDDSETVCRLLTRIINNDPEMECIAAVKSPKLVVEAIKKHKPDVITLDIHMPEIDGVTLLKQILLQFSIPTVMISALCKEDGTYVLDALEAGAVDYIQKPSLSEVKTLEPIICEKIKNARLARVKKPTMEIMSESSFPRLSTRGIDFSYLIAIGSSTGGTEALKTILIHLPEQIPPIIIVQHIPPVFSKAFADRMNQLCSFEVKEAEDGDLVEPNRVLIAPGGKQMSVQQIGEKLKIIINDAPPVNRHKPSVDFLFDSIAALKRKRVTAAILTGMGADGARGLVKLRKNGASTFAQDEATSIIFGMPKEALRLGGAEKAVPLDQIATHLLNACRSSSHRNIA